MAPAAGIELYIFYNGSFTHDLAWHLGVYNPATPLNPDPAVEWYTAPSYTYAIRHPKAGLILFDTGNHRDNATGRIPEETELFPWDVKPGEHYLAALAGAGFSPQAADLLVLSHLHNDHAGNLDLFAGTRAGQHVVVQESELAHALVVTHKQGRRYVDSYNPGDFAGIPGIAFTTISGDVEIADGVELIHLPGHTPGSQGMVVHTAGDGVIILTADAVNQARNYGPPPMAPGILDNQHAWLQSIDKLRVLQQRHQARLVFGHDWAQYTGELRMAPDHYE
jgi:N-acyl homoserine lactone hydrolase